MENWKTVRLGDVCILEKGQQIDTSLLDDSKPFRYINGGIKESGYFDNFNTSGESVLISEGGASCGYINYVNENFWCGCHCYRLHDIKVFPKYLFHALKANQQRIMALRTGSAMPNIQKSTIQKFELKIHDDSTTQKKVSTMLDKCNELIEKHKQTLEKYDTLIKSRFIEMFGNKPVESGKWKVEKLEDVCDLITDGTHKTPNYQQKGIRFISAKNIINGKIDLTDTKFITEEEYKQIQKRCRVEKNDVLLTKSGSLGSSAIIDFDIPIGLFESLAVIKYKRNLLNGIFVKELLSAESSQKQFNNGVKGIAIKHLHLNVIATLKIPIPPIKLQNDFASFVQQIDKSKFAVQKSLEKTETLYKSLMQRYFA